MPELPDVLRFKSHLDRTALGRRIASVKVNDPLVVGRLGRRSLAEELPGRTLRRSRSHGKYLFARADPPGARKPDRSIWVVFHFGMTGAFAFLRRGEAEPRHSRVLFRFRDGSALVFVCPRRFGRVALVDRPEDLILRKGLGPDPLAPGFGADELRRALSGRKGSIKAVLLDQTAIAGLGNLYADEALFQAGIHPRVPAASLRVSEWKRLGRVLDRALRTAVGRGVEVSGFPRGWLLPRRRQGETCPRCGASLARTVVGGRTTYFCPQHQKWGMGRSAIG